MPWRVFVLHTVVLLTGTSLLDELYCNQPLGCLFEPGATVFRVWAPTAPTVSLCLYAHPEGGAPRVVPMRANPDGSWEVRLIEDCRGLYYTLRANGREVIDPYARAVTRHDGRGIVLDDRTPVTPRPTFAPEEAIVYELHVRDFTIDPDSGVRLKGKFLGLTEAGTRCGDLTTGLDHLTELGVNVVQLMPVADFLNDGTAYGWGYDSVHFNAPDAWYATSPEQSVGELKQLVSALHARGMRVTLDVVYNHTMENPQRVFSFEGLVPGYYYRLRPDATLYNGSGVGNEFRSEAPMARRFLLDSTRYWVEEVGVDGFRFDLMGLIDIETMTEVVDSLHRIDPKLLIYGEPWAAGETPIRITSKGTQRGRGFAVFNDNFRDALKGHVFTPTDAGFVQTGRHADRVRLGIDGSVDDFADSPLESLNYVECHDNHTFWDRLTLSMPEASEQEREAADRLGAAVLFTSRGIPFLQSGQEFRRTKGGEDNTYNLPDRVNMIRWKDKAKHRELYAYYRGLIALRKAHPMFRLGTAEFLNSPDGTVVYTLRDRWEEAVLAFNPLTAPLTVTLAPGQWRVYADGTRASADPFAVVSGTVRVPPRSSLIVGRGL
ncbi:MAG: type I pullulanase [Candidatus Eremiobacterota bacterium]